MTPEEQLNAIIGEAIKALVDSGASPSFLGSFAAVYGPRFAQHLGVNTEAPPDLRTVITEAVTDAVHKALSHQPDSAESGKTVPIQVICGGKRTSVTVRQSRIDQLAQISSKPRKLVRELAAAAPANSDNRSAWLDQQIEAYLALQNQPRAGASTH